MWFCTYLPHRVTNRFRRMPLTLAHDKSAILSGLRFCFNSFILTAKEPLSEHDQVCGELIDYFPMKKEQTGSRAAEHIHWVLDKYAKVCLKYLETFPKRLSNGPKCPKIVQKDSEINLTKENVCWLNSYQIFSQSNGLKSCEWLKLQPCYH